MVIENYMPDFAVEAVYDLTVPSLQAHGIKAVWSIWTIPALLGTTLTGRQR